MVTSENDSDEILTLDSPWITITVHDHAKGRAYHALATGDFATTNPLRYTKAIQIGIKICQTNKKP